MASTGSGWPSRRRGRGWRASQGRGLSAAPAGTSALRALGQMAVDRLQADDARGTQPLGQLIDQPVELGGVGVGGEIGLGGARAGPSPGPRAA